MKVFIHGCLILFFTFIHGSLYGQIIDLQWNTFLGSTSSDEGYAIVLDNSENIYITGYSTASWGSPIHPHSGGDDIIVVCLDNSGNVVWNTFLGSGSNDYGLDITMDGSGNILVTGYSDASWGSPKNAYSGSTDAFVARLNSSGNLLGNTFLGSTGEDYGDGIAVNSAGNITVCGGSDTVWGSPVNPHQGGWEIMVACLDDSGNLLWNTFHGAADNDFGTSLMTDDSHNTYLIGHSWNSWGSPINAHSGGFDAFVACLDGSGNLIRNTFIGSSNYDFGYDIVLSNSGNIYVTGESYDDSWGSPVNAHSGGYDAFVACFDNTGNLLWNTFMGSALDDYTNGIVLNDSGRIYVTGESVAPWGIPVHSHHGGWDVYTVCLDSLGNRIWNTFSGSNSQDYGYAIALDLSGSVYLTGNGFNTWGTPVSPHTGGYDALVAKIMPLPSPDIKANGSDDPIDINVSDLLRVNISLKTNGVTHDVDWWLLYKGPSGWHYFNFNSRKWIDGLIVSRQGALTELGDTKVFKSSNLSPGSYTFYFGVDLNLDGKITQGELYDDQVRVTVTN